MKVPPFTLVQLHYFAAAVECGSMTAASRELRAFLAHSQNSPAPPPTRARHWSATSPWAASRRWPRSGFPGSSPVSARRTPAVSVHVLEAEHAELKRALRAGECEVALAYGYDLEEDLVPAHIGSAPPYVLPPGHHRLAGHTAVALRDLANDPMILLDLPHSAGYFLSLFAERGLEPLIRHRSTGRHRADP